MHKTQIKHKTETSETETMRYRELEERTTNYLVNVVALCKLLPRDIINDRLIDQVVRSSGSIGSNYREANEALSTKDFVYRIRISRKEAKETNHWLVAIGEANPSVRENVGRLGQEALEFRKIFSAILSKVVH